MASSRSSRVEALAVGLQSGVKPSRVCLMRHLLLLLRRRAARDARLPATAMINRRIGDLPGHRRPGGLCRARRRFHARNRRAKSKRAAIDNLTSTPLGAERDITGAFAVAESRADSRALRATPHSRRYPGGHRVDRAAASPIVRRQPAETREEYYHHDAANDIATIN